MCFFFAGKIIYKKQPVILLAAHLPHTDRERVAFLAEVAEEVEKAATAHSQTPEGAPWAAALYLWAGDLNLTCHRTLDNETPKPAPSPEVLKALNRLRHHPREGRPPAG